MSSTLGLLNPFRYRGYVYDGETGLYYLQTRYYDPSICRFICADGLTSTGQGAFGSNMYAYCENNPVAYSDATGYARNYCVMMTDSGTRINMVTMRKITKDNQPAAKTEEQIVLEAEHIAIYKGVLVFKIEGLGSTGFSCGSIFIGNDVNENTVKHEYGHFVQLSELGMPKYLRYIVFPSVKEFHKDPFILQKYYSFPWELLADLFGGVERNFDYLPNAEAEAQLYWDEITGNNN